MSPEPSGALTAEPVSALDPPAQLSMTILATTGSLDASKKYDDFLRIIA
jgi:hypothetical protein